MRRYVQATISCKSKTRNIVNNASQGVLIDVQQVDPEKMRKSVYQLSREQNDNQGCGTM